MKFIGTCQEDIHECWIDFYSIGHIIFGYLVYFFATIVVLLLGFDRTWGEYALLTTVVIGIIWEIFENTLLKNTRFKWNRKADCLINSLMDIVFVFLGGSLAYVFSAWEFGQLFVATIVFMTIFYLAYEITSRLTLRKMETDAK